MDVLSDNEDTVNYLMEQVADIDINLEDENWKKSFILCMWRWNWWTFMYRKYILEKWNYIVNYLIEHGANINKKKTVIIYSL